MAMPAGTPFMLRSCPTACPGKVRWLTVAHGGAPSVLNHAGPPDKENDLRDQLAELSAQIDALRWQVHESDERLRLRDILGGIGFILGLAGVALYMKARRRRA